ncbi:hypothetical protein ACHHYP_20531 [Achlya hypogyna]|uniref:CBM1 domain-containing protein n=1 Tax=Achlya hypogyna TaxID=1202772 RepID=A0A1V9YJJ9_ACHHY|nr:hypothetical protein ACHHYP_20531 [Achlya hypogyna]
MVRAWTLACTALLTTVDAEQALRGNVNSQCTQCGGFGWLCPTTCAAGTVCTYISSFVSACQPPPPSPGTIATNDQCGGTSNGFKANGRTCASTDECVALTSYYAQCLRKFN